MGMKCHTQNANSSKFFYKLQSCCQPETKTKRLQFSVSTSFGIYREIRGARLAFVDIFRCWLCAKALALLGIPNESSAILVFQLISDTLALWIFVLIPPMIIIIVILRTNTECRDIAKTKKQMMRLEV